MSLATGDLEKHDMIDVCFCQRATLAAFEQWLASRGQYLYKIPMHLAEDYDPERDGVSYGIGFHY